VTAAVVKRRTVALGIVVGMPVSAVLVLLAAQDVDWARLRHLLATVDPLRAVLAVVAIAGIYSLQALRWRWIARRSGWLAWRTYMQMIVSSVAVNNIVPGRPGELLRSYWLARAQRIDQGRALATVFVDRSSDVIVLVLALAVTYPFVPHPGWLAHVTTAAAVIAGVLVLGLAGAKGWAAWRRRAGRPATVAQSWLRQQASGLTHGTAAAVNRRDLVVVYALTVAAWALWCVAAWLVAGCFGVALTPLELVFVTAVVNLGASVPSSPGFIGTFQWLCVAALGLFDVARTDAFAFSILMHAVWYIPTTVVGAGIGVRQAYRWRLAGRRARLQAPVVSPPASPGVRAPTASD
jgi:glycosyltransferase 2 family protein